MKNLLNSLLTPIVLILCAVAQISFINTTTKQNEITLILCGVFSIYLFADVYTTLTTKKQ
jgi:hypothetical protein